ncbi:MAG TPA: hypothetical protein VE622_03400 [Nitrososphaeraceae archaeon]|nr:hypothetical protein [Nitrososphaeraceae archaeon]
MYAYFAYLPNITLGDPVRERFVSTRSTMPEYVFTERYFEGFIKEAGYNWV